MTGSEVGSGLVLSGEAERFLLAGLVLTGEADRFLLAGRAMAASDGIGEAWFCGPVVRLLCMHFRTMENALQSSPFPASRRWLQTAVEQRHPCSLKSVATVFSLIKKMDDRLDLLSGKTPRDIGFSIGSRESRGCPRPSSAFCSEQ